MNGAARAVIGLALVATLGACGGSTATPGQATISGGTPTASPSAGDSLLIGDPAVKACELVPKTEFETLLGETLSDGIAGTGNCKLYSDDGSGGILYISVGAWTTFKAAAQTLHATPLPGLGDEALRTDDNGMYVRVGMQGLYVRFIAENEKDPGRLQTKGKSAADRLVTSLRAGTTPFAGTPSATP